MKYSNNLIIHIPHSSLNVPKFYEDKLLINKEKFNKENIFISDYLVDTFIPKFNTNIVKFPYSRLFCDVERFKDDSKECMSKKGMGVIYEKDSQGNIFINVDNQYKKDIISKYYDPYHNNFDNLVTNILKEYNKCYIIDLHSFSQKFVNKVLELHNLPDICIGFEDDFKDEELIDYTINHFKSFGYKVKINYPYSGTIIPNKYYQSKDNRIKSIMIEINKKIYLDNNKTINKEKTNKLQECMNTYYKYFL